MEAELKLKELNVKRGTIKRQLTSFRKHFDKVQQETTITAPILVELRTRLARTGTFLDNFEAIQSEIEAISADLDSEYSQRESFEDAYFSLIASAEQFLSEHETHEVQSIVGNQSVRGSGSVISANATSSNIKLPTINLPNFDGNYLHWREFYDIFRAIIHNNNDLGASQKLCYLRSSLSGEAAGVIQSFEISDQNYEIAWDLLKQRYDNKRRIIFSHGRALLELGSIVKESHVAIRQLIDNVRRHVRCLEALGHSLDGCDALLIPLIMSKVDIVTNKEWETIVSADSSTETIPTLDDVINFLTQKYNTLEAIESKRATVDSKPTTSVGTKPRTSSSKKSFVSSNMSCYHCKGAHSIYKCQDFLNLPINSRVEQVKKLDLCINCLRPGHRVSDCKYSNCKTCNKKHNSLVHFEIPADTNNPTSVLSSIVELGSTQVLLATALVQIFDSTGKSHTCRALLDCGSQSNFITRELFEKLKLKGIQSEISIIGINQVTSNSLHKCNVEIQSKVNEYKFSLSCLILNRICESLPSTRLEISKFDIPSNIKLADPFFHKPSKVDMLLGADIFWQLLCIGQIKSGKQDPILQKTKLGWIITGAVSNQFSQETRCNLSTNTEVQEQLSKFWELEEVTSKRAFSKEEKQCEAHFIEHTRRDSSGRFIVSIPFKESVDRLGDSFEVAKKRFYSLEHKLERNQILKTMYVQFMQEYISLKHMSVAQSNDKLQPVYYMPHHGVLKETSTTSKLRVVFDGSSPTRTGVSINDLQMVGPTIQDDLISLLLRFRKHSIVISADIEKMYRQVLVDPTQRSLQRIVWRSDSSKPLVSYELNTVTYGTASASYLAIRSLQELAHQVQTQAPEASRVIIDDFYVDDLLTGAETIEEAISICEQVNGVLLQGGFQLRKWISNEPLIFERLARSEILSSTLDFGESANSKTLGLLWASHNDQLFYNINTAQNKSSITKRMILSSASQIFDPLGLLSACTIMAKILLQELWQAKLSWDEVVSVRMHTKWVKFLTELSELNNLKIPRHVICKHAINVQLHLFSDASELAYGACAYIRSTDLEGNISTHLLCAKTKVAPLKKLSIPRLELSGALVATRLANKVMQSFKIQFDNCYFWCDSTIVLGWIRTPLNQLKTFVCNRVAEIQETAEPFQWNHVISVENPADLLSRSVSPMILSESTLWWHGPNWLSLSDRDWPTCRIEFQDLKELPELKTISNTYIVREELDIFERYSSLRKLINIVAFCLRFCHNAKGKNQQRKSSSLSIIERSEAMTALVKMAQFQCFEDEVVRLNKSKQLQNRSKLRSLSPFVDEKGVLRVGGRLAYSDLHYNTKHPIILPAKHNLTRLIAMQEHNRLLHCGSQALLNSLREQYWPISGRNLTRKITRQCVRCFRANPRPLVSIMGNLPKDRITPIPPFYNCGIDYAGPFQTKSRQGRGFKVYKSYLCLIVCFSTKAIHLEVVSDLTSECFLAALRRFIARRGRPSNIYSDNGTNFIGANNELRELGRFLTDNTKVITESCNTESIDWHFIPAASPHFGGLWEAGVKSTKHHLKRVVGNALLTFEDFGTLTTQIESILNSRPLSPLSNNPSDLEPLTPAHFLIGRKLTSLPDPDLRHIQENRLSRYQRVQQLNQHFWSRWSKEYLSELQQRGKWTNKGGQVQKNTLVLIKEDNLPPLQWRIGRILELHPGQDGVVRVVSIRTNKGVIKRSVTKICPFPESNDLVQ